MSEIALVHMPYAPVTHPSIGLGVLASALTRAGIGNRVMYPSLDFCREIGLDNYSALAASPGHSLLAEWTFQHAAFPQHQPPAEEFLERSIRGLSPRCRHLLTGRFPSSTVVDRLVQVRRLAGEFVDRTARQVLDSGARVVGCTSTFQQHCAALALLRRVRELEPEVVTVIGGANCESVMGLATLRCFPWLDVVVSGEADLLIVDLCRELLDHGPELDGVELPYGAMTRFDSPRSNDGSNGVPRAVVGEMDRVPVPDFQDYFRDLNRTGLDAFVTPGLLIETSRGCWWGAKSHCTFCGLNGGQMSFRSKSPERVLQEFRQLREIYGIDRFEAVDNILDMGFLSSVMPALAAAPESYSIFFETKANLRREQMELMATAGVTWIQPGIESLQRDALALLRKGNTPAINVECLKWAREFGVRVEWLLLHDIPGEQDSWYARLADRLASLFHLEPPSGLTAVEFHRFSPYQSNPGEFGLELVPQPGYRTVYPVAEDEAGDLAYYFADVSPSAAGRGSGPGLEACVRAIAEWRTTWARAQAGGGGQPPKLLFEQVGDRVRLTDTRPCAAEPECLLDEVESAVVRACDRAGTRDALLHRLADDRELPVDEAALDAALARLEERRAVLNLGGAYVALALRAISEPLTDTSPAGVPHVGRYVDQWLRTQLEDLPIPAALVSSLLRRPSPRPAVPRPGEG